MANSEVLSKLIKEVQEESTPVVKFANQLVEEYVRDLDEAMRELDTIMVSIGENYIEEIPDSTIQLLRVILYKLVR